MTEPGVAGTRPALGSARETFGEGRPARRALRALLIPYRTDARHAFPQLGPLSGLPLETFSHGRSGVR